MAKVFGASATAIGLLTILLLNLNICFSTELEESESYDFLSKIPHIGSYSILKLREKRQTLSIDLKNQYQSVSQNPTESSEKSPSASSVQNADQTNNTNGDKDVKQEPPGNATQSTSIVVPMYASDRPLLGANGTGQRKDFSEKPSSKPAVVSEPIQPVSKKPNQFPKKALTSALPTITPIDEIVDNIDVPENETLTSLKNRHFTINQTSDHHVFYNSTIYIDKIQADMFWDSFKNISHNSMLSQSHRRAMTLELTFDFPFYGNPVRNVTVATGGFLYTGEYVHSWLAATQYIAPLMANFDTSLSNDSFVRLKDNGTAFTVIWENVSLQDKQEVGKFTFSTTLHKNGDIVFTYFSVPILIHSIQDDKHPVKVGLSDAYIIDKVIFFARRKTIYEYHRVNFGSSEIQNSTIIYLKALPTCLSYTDCESCVNHNTTFDCAWCPILNRCSTGTDRKRQDWLQKGCDRAQITQASSCPAIGQKGNNPTHAAGNNNDTSTDHDDIDHDNGSAGGGNWDPAHTNDIKTATQSSKRESSKASMDSFNGVGESKSMGLVVGFMLPICLVMTILVWIFYAYRNPHTKSGQLLIQYRPSQWSWRRGEARYTAATIHM